MNSSSGPDPPPEAQADTPNPWSSRGYLPHFDSDQVYQSITFRLADSLPKDVLRRVLEDTERLPPDQQDKERRLRLEHLMDQGHGSGILRHAPLAQIVIDTLSHGIGSRYGLLEWVVMPNHVHALIEPIHNWRLSDIVGSWKSYSGRRIMDHLRTHGAPGVGPGITNAKSPRTGPESQDTGPFPPVWFREHWDRFIRDETHFSRVRDYIRNNPVKAGLAALPEDWPWSSASLTLQKS
jgi:putative transposase